MNVLIAEDEALAAERLQYMLRQCEPSIENIDHVDSIREFISFFRDNPTIDLILLDIELADGKSFEIFDKIPVALPVIFTTAYDQYAIQAFKFNSIDYLLKPVQEADLKTAIAKFKRFAGVRVLDLQEVNTLRQLLLHAGKKYKERIIIKSGNKIQFKVIGDVALFQAEGKVSYVILKKEARKHLIDYTLEELEATLDPKQFFRINRKYIVSIDVIQEVKGLISTKLEVKLTQACEQELYVSRERAHDFKRWLDR